jgi:hypothetical protein
MTAILPPIGVFRHVVSIAASVARDICGDNPVWITMLSAWWRSDL